MAGNPFFQGVDPAGAPSPVTPSQDVTDTKGGIGYADIEPAGYGPAVAPYDISGPQDIAGITAGTTAAGALSGAGVIYPQGPRQAAAETFLNSPQGFGAMNITDGFPDYENTDIAPGDLVPPLIPATGAGYPGTSQEGIPQFTAGLGGAALPGVPPEAGNLGPGGGDYPGTSQDGLQKYGTS